MNKILGRLKDNFILKLISLGIAFLIWILVTNSNDPTHSMLINNVPINIVNEDAIDDIGKVAEPEGSATATIKVTERNYILRRLSRTGSDFYIEADLENLTDLNTVPLSVTCTNSAVTWDEITIWPTSLKVSLEDKVEQAFAVTTVPSGNVAEGYAVGSTEVLQGKNILLAGPKSLVGIISQVTAPFSVSGVSEDQTMTSTLRVTDKNGSELTDAQMSRLELKDSNGNLLTNQQVQVAVKLWREQPDVTVRVNTTGTPAGGYYISQISTIPQSVTLIGTEEALKELGGVLTAVNEISVENIRDNISTEIDLTETLSGISDVRLPAEADPIISVEIQVEKSGDLKLEVPMSELNLENRPDDLKLVFTPADLLPVTVHAVRAGVKAISAADVSASVDLSACTGEGSYEIPVQILLPDGYELSSEVKVTVSASAIVDTTPAERESERLSSLLQPVIRAATERESEDN